jgi:Bacterial Ig domain
MLTDRIQFTASDGSLTSNIGTVTLTRIGVGDPGTLPDLAILTAEDAEVTGQLPAFAGRGPVTFELVHNGALGTASIVDPAGTFRYVPRPDVFGQDKFTVRARRGDVVSNVATVSVEITPVADAPVAHNGRYQTRRRTTIAGSVEGMDVDGSPLRFAVSGRRRLAGELRLDAETGAFTFQPAPGSAGTGWFTFTVTDDTGRTDTGRITIAVRP